MLARNATGGPQRLLRRGGTRGAAAVTTALADFRSDTVTQATEAMRKAMASAQTGDDVYEEDATVAKLESDVAQMCGKEAGLFCATGTLCNQLAVRTHLSGSPPFTVVADRRSHVFQWENAGISYFTGAGVIPVGPTDGGLVTVADVLGALAPDGNVHVAPTRLVVLENPVDGRVVPLEEIERIRAALPDGVAMHLDGARLWHAAAKTGTPLRRWAAAADSVTLCVSKALGAPVGSVLVGERAWIQRARRLRKLYGGGWRQAGHLAAAASVAITEHFPEQLNRDHANAEWLAGALVEAGFVLPRPVETNMVWLQLPPTHPGRASWDWARVGEELRGHNLRVTFCGAADAPQRLLVHFGTDRASCERLLHHLQEILRR